MLNNIILFLRLGRDAETQQTRTTATKFPCERLDTPDSVLSLPVALEVKLSLRSLACGNSSRE